jgi:mono/diheme cytochrome c family protein
MLMAAAAACGLASCAVELQNLRPAQELASQARPPGSAYLGWRIFQERCSGCHGPAAQGTDKGPDLLPRLRDIGPRQFVGSVLDRYDWSSTQDPTRRPAAPGEAAIDHVLKRQDTALVMPAWAGEPSVQAHIVDLYAYLRGRADGTIDTGTPRR